LMAAGWDDDFILKIRPAIIALRKHFSIFIGTF